jgi:hypothetical protein
LALQKRFPGAQPVHERLGYERATDLLRDIDAVVLGRPGPAMTISLGSLQSPIDEPTLDEVVAFTDAWISKRHRDGREPLVSALGWALRSRFPGDEPVHSVLGYGGLAALIEDTGAFALEGPRSRATIHRIPETVQ